MLSLLCNLRYFIFIDTTNDLSGNIRGSNKVQVLEVYHFMLLIFVASLPCLRTDAQFCPGYLCYVSLKSVRRWSVVRPSIHICINIIYTLPKYVSKYVSEIANFNQHLPEAM